MNPSILFAIFSIHLYIPVTGLGGKSPKELTCLFGCCPYPKLSFDVPNCHYKPIACIGYLDTNFFLNCKNNKHHSQSHNTSHKTGEGGERNEPNILSAWTCMYKVGQQYIIIKLTTNNNNKCHREQYMVSSLAPMWTVTGI